MCKHYYILTSDMKNISKSHIGIVFTCESCNSVIFSHGDMFEMRKYGECPECGNRNSKQHARLYSLHVFLKEAEEQGLFYVLIKNDNDNRFRLFSCKQFCNKSSEIRTFTIGGIVRGYYNVAQDGSWVDESSSVIGSAYIQEQSSIQRFNTVEDYALVSASECSSGCVINEMSFIRNVTISCNCKISGSSEIIAGRRFFSDTMNYCIIAYDSIISGSSKIIGGFKLFNCNVFSSIIRSKQKIIRKRNFACRHKEINIE